MTIVLHHGPCGDGDVSYRMCHCPSDPVKEDQLNQAKKIPKTVKTEFINKTKDHDDQNEIATGSATAGLTSDKNKNASSSNKQGGQIESSKRGSGTGTGSTGLSSKNESRKHSSEQPSINHSFPASSRRRHHQQRIFVHRDHSEPYTIRFSTTYPNALRSIIDPEAFDFTIHQINCMFQQAEKCRCSTCLQSFLGFLTCTFIYSCWENKYEKCLKSVSKFIQDQNNRVYLSHGLRLIDPVEKGLRNFEIIIINDGANSDSANASVDHQVQD